MLSLKAYILMMLLFIVFVSDLQADFRQNEYNDLRISTAKTPIYTINIVNAFPHNSEAFTQGLIYWNGYLYESTGLYKQSTLRKLNIKSGKAIKKIELPDEYFGEGIAIIGGKIFQLTWKNETCFVYDLATFKQTRKFNYFGEGWGLTTDGKKLMMSNGSSEITFLDPKSFAIIRKILVHDVNRPVINLNELEYIKGEIWANIFMEDVIVRINPETGEVLGWIDLSRLYSKILKKTKMDVLNGIAYDSKNDRIFVTGKYWPKIFEIKVIKK
jgi:glutaminyl-peptide cyclotransferase